MVYVLDINGQPLMPTARHGKVRRLLNSHLAKVVKCCPFTIQLLYPNTKETQPVSLGVDAGSKHIGLAATTEQKVVYQEELIPRNDVVKLLSARRASRRSRRSRKTRYRKPRFNNRVHSKHKGWLAPSVEVKIQEHITAIKNICKILPVSEIHVETAEFDLQRLKAMEEGKPLPVGTDYQLGEQYDFYNTRQYVLHRDGYTCQCCDAHDKDVKLHVHHNRQIHKANFSKGGIRKRNQAPYLVKGFRLFDKVLYQGKEYFIFGRRATGCFDIRTLDGTKVNKGSVSYKKLRIQDTAKAYLKEVRAIPHMNESMCVLA